MKKDINEIALRTLESIEKQNAGFDKEVIDTDGDGSISIAELKAALQRANTAKEKRKTIMIYLGDKIADFAVVCIALAAFLITGDFMGLI